MQNGRHGKHAGQRVMRQIVDGALACLLLLQMGYQLIPEVVHIVLGIIMLVIAAMHIGLNVAWIKSLGRGRASVSRILQVLAAVASLVLIILLGISGLITSGLVPGTASLASWGRAVHLSCAYMALLVLPFHGGLHAARLFTYASATPSARWTLVVWTAVSCGGVYEFVHLGMWDYITLDMPFVLGAEGGLVVYLLQHASVMALAALVGAALNYQARKLGQRTTAVQRA